MLGKTTFLIHQAAHWLEQGKNVIYFTLEISENVVRERTDACLMRINFDQLHSLEKHPYLNRINQLKSKSQGELFIKELPENSHVGHFRHVLQELKLKNSFIPDVIIVDYITICGSSILHSSARGNSNTYYTSVAQELRSLAKEFNVPLWTAAQFDRAGQDSTDVKMGNTGLAIGIQATSDFSVAFMIPDELAAEMKAIGKVLKNRYNNKSKLRHFLIGCDNDKQRYFDVDLSEQVKVMTDTEMENVMNQSTPKMSTGSNMSDWKF